MTATHHDRDARPPRRHSKAFNARVVEGLLTDGLSMPDLAASVGVSLIELATWIERPGVAATLAQLSRLADARAQLLLSRCRAAAALRLIAIASVEKPTEVSRKACLDLLKTDLGSLTPVETSVETPVVVEPTVAPSEEAILAALEALGDD